jgi:hypothetical protein
MTPELSPSREVIHCDALAWLAEHPAAVGSSVVTSLPDLSEVPTLGVDGWRAWFSASARRIVQWLPPEGVAIFFQSDVRRGGVWIDKGYLVQRAVEDEDAQLLWHKIVCRKPPGTITHGRASYSHLLCFSRPRAEPPKRPGPDVLADAGFMPWSRAMGTDACRLACRFLKEETSTRLVVDPFCGHGTVLAVANAMGFDALGIDLSVRQCRAARRLTLEPAVAGSQPVRKAPPP